MEGTEDSYWRTKIVKIFKNKRHEKSPSKRKSIIDWKCEGKVIKGEQRHLWSLKRSQATKSLAREAATDRKAKTRTRTREIEEGTRSQSHKANRASNLEAWAWNSKTKRENQSKS